MQSSHLTLATGTIARTRSPLASSTPTSGSAHVLAEREAGKASTGISVCMVGKKQILLFSLLWENIQAQKQSSDAGQPKKNDKYPQ